MIGNLLKGGDTMNLFFEIHKDIPREGPGDNLSTRKAYQMIEEHLSNPKILDIGCGPGMQTVEIAKLTEGTVLATDMNEGFLDVLSEKMKEFGLTDKVSTQKANMKNLPFKDEQFDLIWSEGAIYIIGFEKGLSEWKRFIKTDGFIAVTELSWLKENPPEESLKFWTDEYPEVDSVEGNIQKAENLGYRLIDTFVLPESAWWDDYYHPLEERLKLFREKYQHDEEALKTIAECQYEIDLYRKYHDYYGYVFYIFQK
jgi:ubiquinone/menaquinone biosynthesis C-methylase UbiE